MEEERPTGAWLAAPREANRGVGRRRLQAFVIAFVLGAAGGCVQFVKGGPAAQLRQTYLDQLLRSRTPVPLDGPESPIALVGLDDESMRRLGRPGREVFATLINRLSEAGAVGIALDIQWRAPDPVNAAVQAAFRSLATRLPAASPELIAAIEAIRAEHDSDSQLEKALRHPPVVAAFYAEPRGGDAVPASWAIASEDCDGFPTFPGAILNIPAFTASAPRHGNLLIRPDTDSRVRVYPLLSRVSGVMVPSLALRAAEVALDTTADARCKGARVTDFSLGVYEGVPLSPNGEVAVNFRGSFAETFPHAIPLWEVIEGKGLERFRGKLVFVGVSNQYDDFFATPVDSWFHGYGIHAVVAHSLMTHHWLRRDDMTMLVETVVASVAAFLVALVFLLSPKLGVRVWIGVGIGFPVLGHILSRVFISQGMLVDALTPGLAATLAAFVCGSFRFVRERARADEEKRQREEAERELGRFFSPTVLQLALNNPGLLAPTKREITILFSDIRGFTKTAEAMSPEALVSILEGYLNRMTAVVFKHRGTLDKYIGDAVMAFFGSPTREENNATLACRAALDMTRELVAMQGEWRAKGLPILEIGIGVNTGEVVVGLIGSKGKTEYTCIGDDVNFASRAEGLTKAYGVRIIVGQNTRDRAGDSEFVFRDLGPVRVQGKTHAVRIFELVADRATLPATPPWIADFEKAIEAFHQRDWDAADASFKKVIAARGDDPPSQSLMAWSQTFRRRPPPDDWDGSLERGK